MVDLLLIEICLLTLVVLSLRHLFEMCERESRANEKQLVYNKVVANKGATHARRDPQVHRLWPRRKRREPDNHP